MGLNQSLQNYLSPPPYRNHARLNKDGVDRYTWLDKAKLHGERSAALSLSKCRTILPGQGFDTVSERRTVNLADWELEIHKA